ncbi:MAG: SRPBCC family protein [Sporocytophaga sp.]|uniref:SRPBCC family protein n=1 Tax=Sporocytophaga sp. TaxID=2231183 RepID=UPI001B29D3AA|nr:SRPBCC family protein [Sporocytophaga sp.]MBO9703499.1 SRPBCC family protein [Sporocytophaga sp.]
MKKFIKYFAVIIFLILITITSLELFSHYVPAKTINNNAPVKTKRGIIIHAPAEKVWTVFTSVDKWPQWQKEIISASLSAPFKPGSVIEWKTNGFSIHSQLQTVELNKEIGWAGEAFGSFAIHVWKFEEKDGYTTVTVKESMEGWLVNLMKGYVQPNLHKATEYWLHTLKQESEK